MPSRLRGTAAQLCSSNCHTSRIWTPTTTITTTITTHTGNCCYLRLLSVVSLLLSARGLLPLLSVLGSGRLGGASVEDPLGAEY